MSSSRSAIPQWIAILIIGAAGAMVSLLWMNQSDDVQGAIARITRNESRIASNETTTQAHKDVIAVMQQNMRAVELHAATLNEAVRDLRASHQEILTELREIRRELKNAPK